MRFVGNFMDRAAPKRLVAAAVGTAVLVTLLGVLLQPVGVTPRTSAAHAATETAVSLIGLFACFLLLARFRVSRALRDLLLVAGILTLVLTNIAFGVVPALLEGLPGEFATWAHVGGRLLSVMVLAATAFAPRRRLKSPRRAVALLVAACVGAIAALGVAVGLLAPVLPLGVDGDRDVGRVAPHPALLVTQLLGAVVFAVAAVGLARRAIRAPDELMAWISAGAVLATFAYLNYAIFPSLYSSWFHVGDLLRAAFYVALLLGALREVDLYRRRADAAAQLEERQRIARNIHDGLAQDLAFLAGRLRDLTLAARGRGEEDVAMLATLSELAQRAFDESRAVIASFAAATGAPLAEVLTRTAEDVASREGGRAIIRVEPGLEVSDEAKEALVRIVREAATNAIRHGGGMRHHLRAGEPTAERSSPVTVGVTLVAGDGLELTIHDDGAGFTRERPGGFGLQSMRKRAAELGGSLSIRSTPAEGTVVGVRLPPEVLRPGSRAGSMPPTASPGTAVGT